jgi:energy-coupling factor transporter transmembrane protein EcfT
MHAFFTVADQPMLSVHPTTRLLAWLALLVGVQALSGTVLAAVFALLPLAGRRGLRRGAQLVWRARWLLASLLVILSWGVAGEPLWQGAGAPTFEGLREALTHFARLLLVLFVVAAFLEAMPLPDLLAATHVLLGPLRHCGVDTERGVVRLLLVLRYVETLPRPRDWRVLLKTPVAVAGERVEVDCQTLRWTDGVIGVGLVAALFCLFR